jgi:hypothetical protein
MSRNEKTSARVATKKPKKQKPIKWHLGESAAVVLVNSIAVIASPEGFVRIVFGETFTNGECHQRSAVMMPRELADQLVLSVGRP